MAATNATTAPTGSGLEVTRNEASGARLAELAALGIAPIGQSSGLSVAPALQVTA